MNTKHAKAAALSRHGRRPLLRAAPFGSGQNKAMVQVLTEKQQAELASIATEVHFRPQATVYSADSSADSAFIVRDGMLKAFRELASGNQRVLVFLFPGDVFGLAENGRYVNSVQTLTPTTCFKIPITALTEMFVRDGDLELQFLFKMTHELREAQRRQIMLTRRDAHGRVAMFLRMLQRRHDDASHIELPMSRLDIARYLGLSSEAVSRATARLRRDGIVAFPSLHVAQIINRSEFHRLTRAA